MKKKLAIIIIILLASGGMTWAILNQSKDSKQQTAPLTKESSQKPKIPGGEKIIDQDSSTKDQFLKNRQKIKAKTSLILHHTPPTTINTARNIHNSRHKNLTLPDLIHKARPSHNPKVHHNL